MTKRRRRDADLGRQLERVTKARAALTKPRPAGSVTSEHVEAARARVHLLNNQIATGWGQVGKLRDELRPVLRSRERLDELETQRADMETVPCNGAGKYADCRFLERARQATDKLAEFPDAAEMDTKIAELRAAIDSGLTDESKAKVGVANARGRSAGP